MTPHEARPRPGEYLVPWIGRIDPALAAARDRDLPTDPEAAYRIGIATGVWIALHRCFKNLDNGVVESDRLLGMALAGELALKRIRDSVNFARAFAHHMQEHPRLAAASEEPTAFTDEEIERERAIGDENPHEGGPDRES